MMPPKDWIIRVTRGFLRKPWVLEVSLLLFVSALVVSPKLKDNWQAIAALVSVASGVVGAGSYLVRLAEHGTQSASAAWGRVGAAADVYGRLAALRGRNLFGPIGWGNNEPPVEVSAAITLQVYDYREHHWIYELSYRLDFPVLTHERIVEVLLVPTIAVNKVPQVGLSPRRAEGVDVATLTFDFQPILEMTPKDADDCTARQDAIRRYVATYLSDPGKVSLELTNDSDKTRQIAASTHPEIPVRYPDVIDPKQLPSLRWRIPAGTRRVLLHLRGLNQIENYEIYVTPPSRCDSLAIYACCEHPLSGHDHVLVGATFDAHPGTFIVEMQSPTPRPCRVARIADLTEADKIAAWRAQDGHVLTPADYVYCTLGLRAPMAAVADQGE